MSDKKYTVTTTSDAIIICPECGAKNETGAHNCVYCGRTLVQVTQTDVEENKIKYSKEFFKEDWEQTKKNLGRLMNEHKNPETKKEAASFETVNQKITDKNPASSSNSKSDSDKKKVFLIVGVILFALVLLFGFMLLIGAINIIPVLFMFLANQISPDSTQNISELIADNEQLGMLLTILPSMFFPVLAVGLFIIALIIFILIILIIIPLVFKQKKTTKTDLKMKCTNCGANNPAGSRICAYCGNHLINSVEKESTLK